MLTCPKESRLRDLRRTGHTRPDHHLLHGCDYNVSQLVVLGPVAVPIPF